MNRHEAKKLAFKKCLPKPPWVRYFKGIRCVHKFEWFAGWGTFSSQERRGQQIIYTWTSYQPKWQFVRSALRSLIKAELYKDRGLR